MAGWFGRKFKEDDDRSYYREKNKLATDPQGVLAGVHRLRRVEPVEAPISMELLDKTNVGHSVLFDSGFSDFVSILNLEADDKKSRVVTIHTDAITQAGFGNVAEFMQGRIQWGAGGVQSEALFDWLFGTTFTVAGAFVRIAVRVDPAFAPLGAGSAVKTGAFAGYGQVGSGRLITPQLTTSLAALAPGATGTAGIPRFAKDVRVQRVLSAAIGVAPAMRVSERPTAFIATDIWSADYGAGVPMEQPLSITPLGSSIAVQNIAGAGVMIPRVVFGLAL